MATPKKPPELLQRAGRRSIYSAKTHPKQAFKLALLGADNKRMADFWGISEATLYNWFKEHPELLESINDGKDGANARVADSLYNRAIGYSHKDVHISNYMGEITKTEIKKHYPPDVGAAKMWLINRDPENWREKVTIENTEVTSKAERIKAARQRVKEMREKGDTINAGSTNNEE